MDVEYGLLVGIVLCVGRLVLLTVQPYTCKLAVAPGTEIYLDTKRYKGTVEVPGIKIFHYSGSLNFACRQHFRDEVYKVAELVPRKELNRRSKAAAKHDELEEIKKLRILILDFTAMSNMDLAGATTLRNLINEYNDLEISVYITGCSGPVYETMRKCKVAEYKEGRFLAIFPTVADAVHFAKCNNEVPTLSGWNGYIYEENCISRL